MINSNLRMLARCLRRRLAVKTVCQGRSARWRRPAPVVALLLSIFAVNNSAHAEGLDLALSDDTANIFVILNPFSPRGSFPGRQLGNRAPRGSELSFGGFVNEAGDNLLHATLMARGVNRTRSTQYKLGAGMKLVGGDLDVDETVSALALGFQTSVLLGFANTSPIDFTFEGFYAPGIASFNDAESYTELAARLQIEVIGQARAYIGYRRLTFETNDFGDQRLDRGVHIGMNITF